MGTRKQQDTRLIGLDFIRFLCALLLLFFHYGYRGMMPEHPLHFHLDIGPLKAIAAYCFLGVELFFVISGFVILNSALHKTPREFFIARFLRIYPAFLICMTFTFCVERWVAVSHPDSIHPLLREYVANLTMLNSFFGVPSMDGVYWTLVYELTFYGWILLMMLFKQLRNFELFILAGLPLSFLGTEIDGEFVRLLMPGYFSFFALGSLFFLNHKYGRTRRRMLLIGAAYLLSLRRLYYVCIEFTTGDTPIDPVVAIIVYTLLIAGFVYVVHHPGLFRRAKLWMFFGNLTYPLYLIHQHIGYILIRLNGDAVNPYALVAGVMLLMIGLSAVIYRFGEVPLRRVMKRAIASIEKRAGN